MIIARTPFRISFTGGSSDIRSFYQHEPGAVVSATINKYVYLSMHPLFNNSGYFLKYSQHEIVDSADKIKHPIIRNVFIRYGIAGVDFNSSSDVPSGTGLGSSSSFTTGLINLCNAYGDRFLSKEAIAKEACHIEIDVLKSPIGKQDQYAAAVGGMNYIQFNPDESVVIEKLRLPREIFHKLERSLLLFWLGDTRTAALVLSGQTKRTKENFPIIKKMADLAGTMRDELKAGNIEDFGKILHDNWTYKKELAKGITNPSVDYYYDLALRNGAEGGKLTGAGSTGFLLLFVPPNKQERVKKILGLYELPFGFDYSGTTIIY